MYSYKMFELFCEDESRHCDREKLRKRRRAKVDHIRRYGSLDWRFHLIGPCAMTSLHLREKSDVEQVGYRLFLTIVNSYWPCPKARGLTQLGFFLWGHFGYFGHISSLSRSLWRVSMRKVMMPWRFRFLVHLVFVETHCTGCFRFVPLTFQAIFSCFLAFTSIDTDTWQFFYLILRLVNAIEL